jgi:uncharacterized Fe-S cluster-containing radical SAM superfamily protein
LTQLETLWFNTGTLCNIQCDHCYIESSPTNDRLVYLTLADVRSYLDEIADQGLGTQQIGITGCSMKRGAVKNRMANRMDITSKLLLLNDK